MTSKLSSDELLRSPIFMFSAIADPPSFHSIALRGFAIRVAVVGALLLLVFSLPAKVIFAQEATQTISGKVTDATTGEALPGATVQIVSLKIGSVVDAEGHYLIRRVPTGSFKVEARLIGYATSTKTVSVAPNENPVVNFGLTERALKQDEIVVTGLSGEIDRNKLGNVIGNVSGAEVSRTETPSAINAIQGRVPGVVATQNSGVPGGGTYITIRGRKTILGSSEPLYVVDGTIIDNSSVTDQHWQSGSIPLGNRITDISPQDIASMQILKGASAAALYGSLAANGVILITTKKGQIGTEDKPATVSFTSSFQTDEKVKAYPLQTKFGQKAGSNLSYGPALAPGTKVYDQSSVPFRSPFTAIQNLTVSGGSLALNYYLSGTHENYEGIAASSSLERETIRLNLGARVLPKLDFQSNTNFITTDNRLPQDGSNTSGIMLGALRTPPEFDNSKVYNADGTQHQFFRAYDNPLWTIQNNKFTTQVNRFIHSTQANWDPLDWARITGRIGYDRYDQLNSERLAFGSSTSNGHAGNVERNALIASNLNLDLSAALHFNPLDIVSTDLILGGQTLWSSLKTEFAKSSNTIPFFDQISAGAQKDANSGLVEVKTVGLFGQLTNTIDDNLAVTAALRRDGSSTFGESNKFHYYPKFGLSYDFAKENYFQSMTDFFDEVRIRASYGEAGSPSLPGAYATNSLYSTFGNNDPWQRETTAGRGGFLGIRQGGGSDQALFQAGAKNISPEISIEREIGIDLGMWKNKVNVEFTFYHATINDMILSVPAPGSSGYDRVLRNAGSMWNEGFEASLGIIPINTPDFVWNTTFNYARNYNLVTSLKVKPNPDGIYGTNDAIGIFGFQGIENSAIVGQPLGVFVGTGYVHDAQGNIVVSKTPGEDPFGFGYVGVPLIDFDSTHIIGNPDPHFTVSWRNEMTIFKDFNISMLLDAVVGQQVWNGTKGALSHFGALKSTEDRNDPWIYQGKPVVDADGKPVTREKYYRYYANSFAYGIEEAVIENGSYMKLRDITITYDWHGLQDYRINTVRFGLSARNLFTITNYTGFDPEVNNFGQSETRGFDYFNLPQTRSYRFSLGITY